MRFNSRISTLAPLVLGLTLACTDDGTGGDGDGDSGSETNDDDTDETRGDDSQDAGDDGQDDGQDAGDDSQDAGDDSQDAGDDSQDAGDDGQDAGDDGQDAGDDDPSDLPPTTLTIGGPDADYPSFTAAIEDWSTQTIPDEGLAFLVTPGDYPERFVVPSFDGADGSNPVVFIANGGEVSVTGSGSEEDDEAMIRLEGTDWVEFNGIGIRDDSGTVEYGYLLVGSETDGASWNLITNAAIRLSNRAAARGIRIESNATLDGGADGNCSNNRFDSLDIDEVGSGIQLLGPRNNDFFGTFIYELPDENNAIVDCTFGLDTGVGHSESNTAFGINAANQAGLEVTGNRFADLAITDSMPLIPAGISAISLDGADGLVADNRIESVSWSGTGGSSVIGIRASVRPDGVLEVVNNFISGLDRGTDYVPGLTDNSLYVRGVWVFRCFQCDPSSALAFVAHNSIHVELPAGRSYPVAAFHLAGGSSGQVDALLRNNLLIAEGLATADSAAAYAVVDGNTDRQFLDNDQNLVWATGPSGLTGMIGQELGGPATEASDLEQWQTVSEAAASSVAAAVEFADLAAGDLHLAGASATDALLLMPALAEVTRDIDGQTRSDPTPAGADEP